MHMYMSIQNSDSQQYAVQIVIIRTVNMKEHLWSLFVGTSGLAAQELFGQVGLLKTLLSHLQQFEQQNPNFMPMSSPQLVFGSIKQGNKWSIGNGNFRFGFPVNVVN